MQDPVGHSFSGPTKNSLWQILLDLEKKFLWTILLEISTCLFLPRLLERIDSWGNSARKFQARYLLDLERFGKKKFNFARSWLILLDITWSCLILLDYAESYLILLDLAWSCLIVLDRAWSCLILLDLAWSCMILLDLG